MAIKPRGPSARGWVRAQRQRNYGWSTCVSEWIDNSIGNGATRIDVTWQPGRIEIRDNGHGCTERMFAALVSPNWHEEDEGVINSVSRYGIGAKDGFLWCQGATQCFSRRKDKCFYIEVDWDSFGDAWDFDTPAEGEIATRSCSAVGLHGDGVLIRQMHNRQIKVNTFDQIHASLAKTFWAAVETGVEINVRYYPSKKKKPRGGLLAGRSMPQLAEGSAIKRQITLADGRTIRIDGGILHASERLSDPGFEYIYGHRVVVKAGGLGAGGMDFERCYFRVFLLGDKTSWQVTTNKDGLHDADEAALGQAVFDTCKSTLEQAGKGDYATMLDQQLLDEVSEQLTAADRKRGKRNPPAQQTGTVEPTGTGAEHTQISKTHDRKGKYRAKGASTPIRLRNSEFGEDEAHLVGKALVKDRLVRLNTLHPYVAEALEQRESRLIFNIAMSLWSFEWINQEDSGQKRHLPREGFIEKLSTMLSSQIEPQHAA